MIGKLNVMTNITAISQFDHIWFLEWYFQSSMMEADILGKILRGGKTFAHFKNLKKSHLLCIVFYLYLMIMKDFCIYIFKFIGFFTKMLSVDFDLIGTGCFYYSHYWPISEQDAIECNDNMQYFIDIIVI